MTSNVYVQAMLRVAGASNGKVAVVVGVAVVTHHLPKQDVKGSHVRAVCARDDRSARPPLSLGHESIATAGANQRTNQCLMTLTRASTSKFSHPKFAKRCTSMVRHSSRFGSGLRKFITGCLQRR